MNKVLDMSEIKSQYDSKIAHAENFKNELCNELSKLINDANIRLGFPLQSRVKSWPSLRDKFIRNKLKLTSIYELQDYIGVRAVLLYKRDSLKLQDIIEHNFYIIKKYDTAERLSSDQFGYSSIHYTVKLPKDWLKVPSLASFGKFQAEIQLRTLPQHIWSEVSHELQYKSRDDVPKELLRSIYRSSALLETVDLEFERLLDEREKYRKVLSIEKDKKLDVDIIEDLLDKYLPEQNKVFNEDYAELHAELIKAGLKTRGELETFLKDNMAYAIAEDKKRVQKELKEAQEAGCPTTPTEDWVRIESGYFYTHVGLVRVILEKR